jgi:hypothetical protein
VARNALITSDILSLVRILAGVAFIAPAAPVASQVYFGSGRMKCSEYTTGATNRTLAYYEASEWLLGYVSGLNSGGHATLVVDPLLATNSTHVLTFAEAYCKTNPDHSIVKAGDDWFKALAK